jgi:hypothetical protein
MCRLINTEGSTTGEGEVGELAPPLVLQLGADNSPLRHRQDECVDVLAHQKQLVPTAGFSWMYGQLGGRQGKDQPAMPGIDVRILEHIAEEGSVCLSVGAVENDVGSTDHGPTLFRPRSAGTVVISTRRPQR